MMPVETVFGATAFHTVHEAVDATKLHPILVNFTAALVPVTIGSDFLGRLSRNETLRSTAWWTLLYAVIITPLTAITGWLFWMSDDNGDPGMTIHKWLGTAFAVLLFVLFFWRRAMHRRQQWPGIAYFFVGAIYIAALVYQGHLGGDKVFSGM